MKNSMGGKRFLTYAEQLTTKEWSTSLPVLPVNDVESIEELRRRLDESSGRSNCGRHIGILAGLKILGENTETEIIEFLEHKTESGDYPCSGYVLNHFFDALFDKYGMLPSYQKEARNFLEQIILDVEKRKLLVQAYTERWYSYYYELEGPEEEGNIVALLSLFKNLEFLWTTLKTDEKVIYLDLLLLDGAEESLIKIMELTKNKQLRVVMDIRAEALFLLYRDYPLCFHEDDPQYFRRKIVEIDENQKSRRIRWLEMLSEIIAEIRVTEIEPIGDLRYEELGKMGEEVVSLIQDKYSKIQPSKYGNYRGLRRVFPKDRDKQLWIPVLQNLVEIYDSQNQLPLPFGVAKSIQCLKEKIPKHFYEEISRTQNKNKKIEAIGMIGWGEHTEIGYEEREIEQVVDEFRIFSKDTDREVRMRIIGILSRRRAKLLRNSSTIMEQYRAIDDLLTEMSENPQINEFEKKRILVALGRDSYDF